MVERALQIAEACIEDMSECGGLLRKDFQACQLKYAYIDKSPSLRSASAPYSVTSKGMTNSASNYTRIKMM